MRIGKRWCGGCGVELEGDLDELFYRNGSRKDGLSNICRVCTREYNKRYYRLHKDAIQENVNKWRRENPAKYKVHLRRYNSIRRLRRAYPTLGRYDADE